jgi:hypothetical protein
MNQDAARPVASVIAGPQADPNLQVVDQEHETSAGNAILAPFTLLERRPVADRDAEGGPWPPQPLLRREKAVRA